MAFNFSADFLFFEESTFRLRTGSGFVMVNYWRNGIVADVSANFTAVVHTCRYYTFN
jgi:hypothetical protein